jgi:biopolymer transport protein TolR
MSFGRLERRQGDAPMSEINVTPLVDVMLVLLVIFIVAAPIMAGRLALDLPRAQTPRAEAPAAAALAVALDAQGQWFLDDRPVSVDALREHLAETGRQRPDTEVQLRADSRVPYGQVAEFIGWAQAAGLSRMGFVAQPAAAR